MKIISFRESYATTPPASRSIARRRFLRGALPLAAIVFVASTFAAAISFQWTSTASLTIGRARHTATLLDDGRVLVAGGLIGGFVNDITATSEIYDPFAGTWSQSGEMSDNRQYHSETLLVDGRVLIAGGGSVHGTTTATLASVDLYDPARGTFTATAPMTMARLLHTATRLRDGRVLVVGGSALGNTAELYDPATGVWTATGNLNESRSRATATLLGNGKVLVVGGIMPDSPFVRATAEIYDPATGIWSDTGSLALGRASHTATLLRSGQVLVAGGFGLNGSISACELYDPAVGVWTATGDLAKMRSSHRATSLPNGQVLVTGGIDTSDKSVVATEVYNPRLGTWTLAGDLATRRYEHTATLLEDGSVSVSGGLGNPGSSKSSELGTRSR